MNGTPQEDNPKRTIDDAIDACENVIWWHRLYSAFVGVLLIGSLWAFYQAFKSQELTVTTLVNQMNLGEVPMTTGAQDERAMSVQKAYIDWSSTRIHVYFAIMGLFLVVFGIFISVYRFHLVEIARNEQIKLGFWRIRIAARNTDPGFQSEVRVSLTEGAFSFDRTTKSKKAKEIESPIPGHPASDLTTAVVNKIFEKFDIDFKKKE